MSQFLDLQKVDDILVNLAVVNSFTEELSTKKYKSNKAKLLVQSQAYEALEVLKKNLKEFGIRIPKKDLQGITKAIRKLEEQLRGFNPLRQLAASYDETASIQESFPMADEDDHPTSSTFTQSLDVRRARSASRNKPKRINFKEPVVILSESKPLQSQCKIKQQRSKSTTVARTQIASYLPDSQIIIPDTPESVSSQADRTVALVNQQPPSSLRIRLIEDNELIPLKDYPEDFWNKLSTGQIDISTFFAPFFED